MGYQPHLIAAPRVGWENDMQPEWLPDDAFPDLEDCYLWRGQIYKRYGYRLLGRLKRIIGATDGSGNASITLQNIPLGRGLSSFTVGSTRYQDRGTAPDAQTLLVNGTGTASLNRASGVLSIIGGPVSTDIIYLPGLPVMGLASLDTGAINSENLIAFDTSYSYLYNAGFVDLTYYKTASPRSNFIWHGSNSQLFWTYNYQKAMFTTNSVPGMDERRFNVLTAGGTTTLVFTGVNVTSSFVVNDIVFIVPDSTTTFGSFSQGSGSVASSTFSTDTTVVVNVASTTNTTTGTLFNVTRQIGDGTTVGDGIKWLDQDVATAPGWANFQPYLNTTGSGAVYLVGALMVVPYRGRLVFLNTQEKAVGVAANSFAQRARWSQNGTVYYTNPVPANYVGGVDPTAWRDDIVGKGGFIDAPTLEKIVSCEFLKDTLVVYFERSTWLLSYTGNENLPFIWNKVNTELGAESTFSVVPFDEVVIAVGNTGIHACDTRDVARIDNKIPNEVFNFQNQTDGPKRVYGLRDYYNELIYWSAPYLGADFNTGAPEGQFVTFPNTVIVFNYVDKSWSLFNDSFTCFGYYQTIAGDNRTWGMMSTWSESDFAWSAPQNQSLFPYSVAGNQQGYVEILLQQINNDESLFISDISISGNTLTVDSFNNNLEDGDFVKFISANGITGIVGNIYKIKVENVGGPPAVPNPNQFKIDQVGASGTFTGPGTIARVNNISILSKRFNPFLEQGAQFNIGYIDFLVDSTAAGTFDVDIYIDGNSSTPINDSGSVLSNEVVTYPESTYERNPDISLVNDKLWKRLYVNTVGQSIQFQIQLNDQQMQTSVISEQSSIVVHAVILWMSKAGRLINV